MSAHPVDSHVGGRIRLRRKILGLSQDELGKSVGVTFQQVQKYERGTNRVGSSRLYELSKTLGVTVGYFFDSFSQNSTSGFAEDASNFGNEQLESKETINLIQAYYKIKDPKVRQKMLSLMKSLETEAVSA